MNRAALLLVFGISLACGGMGAPNLNDSLESTKWDIDWTGSSNETITFLPGGAVLHSWTVEGTTWTVDGDVIHVTKLFEDAYMDFTRRDECTMSVVGNYPNAAGQKTYVGQVVWDHPKCR